MNCDEARRHWGLYHDSEGDAELYLRINAHLEDCSDCAEWFALQSRLEELIAERLRAPEAAVGWPELDLREAPAVGTCGPASHVPGLPSGSAPATPAPASPAGSPELWEAVLVHSGVRRPMVARRWVFFSALAAMAAGVLAAVVLWPVGDRTASADLAKVTAEYHEQFAAGTKPVAFASGSDLEVEQYLRGEVTFPVRCPPRRDSGFLVRGAGVCRKPGCDLVYLVGHVEEAPVSVFVLSRDDLARFPQQVEAVRRNGRHQWRDGPNEVLMAEIDQSIVLIVGRTSAERLVRVVEAYGSYHDGHHI